ncbi:class I SAM-dependent methyltransferase [Flaviflexus ciconiae]|uniref:site-specific DNA-methyltransferase (adenine-specific) n=1 Tax=Flaviflexus ciconiae TaxID=2496867 RepID=A0A3S9PZT7_9ACTO|nr:class I SAM-dependent methyltransferase [Flaviflexus ciconiae]AZQ77844.1 class I SAM-dependent methyltransferase [Flaviflexus ciconiae]
MSKFEAKVLPNSDKLRGGYYTPAPIAKFLTNWAVPVSPRMNRQVRVLEPSCGDGAILQNLNSGDLDVTAVEIVESEAKKAASLGIGKVINEDFFIWVQERSRDLEFDAVVGNPPYIRFGNWDTKSRDSALTLMKNSGLRPSKLTNAWVPFVVGAINSTRLGGKVGLVLPAEILQVGYAAQLRDYLVAHCSHITIVSFDKLVFPGVLQEVILLLLEVGHGPAMIRTHEVHDVSALENLRVDGEEVRASLNPGEKWTYYYLDTELIKLLRNVQSNEAFSPVSRSARVNVGIVTGRNSFFCLTSEESKSKGLEPWTIPLLSRSGHLQGVTLTHSDFSENEAKDYRTRLLAIPENTEIHKFPRLASYVQAGEEAEVHTGYKTRIRKSWWSVPSIAIPDGFMLRQIHRSPRIYGNEARATSTDTVHRVFLETSAFTAEQLSVAALNSVTCALAEVYGRSYGGGILELEPSEASGLLIPDPKLIEKKLVVNVDSLLRLGKEDEARQLVDQVVLQNILNMPSREVEGFSRILTTMRERRLKRSRK